MTNDVSSAEEEAGAPAGAAPAPPVGEVNNPLKNLEHIFGADGVASEDDKDAAAAANDDDERGGGDGGQLSGASGGGGQGYNPIKTMIHARERELSNIAESKQTLLGDQLKETRAELEGCNQKFHALRDDFHYNLRLLKVRARGAAARGGRQGGAGGAPLGPFFPSLIPSHRKPKNQIPALFSFPYMTKYRHTL
jgi:hypothetical protein